MVARLGSFLGSDPRERAKQGEDDRSGQGARPSWASAAAAFSLLSAGARGGGSVAVSRAMEETRWWRAGIGKEEGRRGKVAVMILGGRPGRELG